MAGGRTMASGSGPISASVPSKSRKSASSGGEAQAVEIAEGHALTRVGVERVQEAAAPPGDVLLAHACDQRAASARGAPRRGIESAR